ncbi:type II secretion system F family protein [Tenuibacillus multivorans]|uniref:Tight adherence protein C n=1 Tax=Tenuibacillus multivorans TaxID=237069 RepID=A0A1G9WPE9_9BACI|nr:type II secretion system F family protein [Tenuibacillus multivorans]GEL77980.1 type II secretion system protein [Tenuibacillus multivorans]SDM86454.1 tight adherence protein C [Tenuibacillus multivorans]
MLVVLYMMTIVFIIGGFILYRKEKVQKITSRKSYINGVSGTAALDITEEDDEKDRSLFQRIIEPKLKEFKRRFRRQMPNKKQEKLELKLMRAGNPMGLTPFEYRLVQMILYLLIPFLFSVLALIGNLSFGRGLFVAVLGLGLAAYLPVVYLRMKTATRYTEAVKELPDFIDLLAVSMEAGLGFDSALGKVVSKQEGVLSKEFRRCLEELKLGKTRRQALSGVRERLEVDDVKLLVGSIIQAEQLGVGMVQTLRVQSDEVRERRKQRAEEQAMKAPIKMLFPLVLFIFPCIFIVLLGPAVIEIIGMFSSR